MPIEETLVLIKPDGMERRLEEAWALLRQALEEFLAGRGM